MKAEDDSSLQRPDVEELEQTTEKTRLALERLTSSKIAAAMPVRCADKVVSQPWLFIFLSLKRFKRRKVVFQV